MLRGLPASAAATLIAAFQSNWIGPWKFVAAWASDHVGETDIDTVGEGSSAICLRHEQRPLGALHRHSMPANSIDTNRMPSNVASGMCETSAKLTGITAVPRRWIMIGAISVG